MAIIGLVLFSMLIFFEYEQINWYNAMIGKTYTYTEEMVRSGQYRLAYKALVGLYGLIYSIIGVFYLKNNKKTSANEN